VPVGFECATASLAVIAVLVQASRKRAGVDAIVAAMEFLGQCGIRPDAETMEVILSITFLTKSFSCVLNCMQ
jgi:hypothetical protein